MKISLNMDECLGMHSGSEQGKITEATIVSAQKGDWVARKSLVKAYDPLIEKLARKNAPNPSDLPIYIEAGRNGIVHALKKFNAKQGAGKFSVFCLDFIHAEMNRAGNVQKGFFSRLFGR